MINDFHGQRERSELINLPGLLPPLPSGTELSAEVLPWGKRRASQSRTPKLTVAISSMASPHPF